MGSVWVADHRTLQTQVVVKFMHVQLARDKESVLRFSREAAAGANVKSPHVVQVLDHGAAPDGTPFIVMELLEGSDLAAYCEKNAPISLPEVDHVISQTSKALARAHERSIVHRDIKPQNIFLTNVGGGELFVKVLDFGIAKASWLQRGISSATKTGTLMGSPHYMSPEQMIGAKGIDYRTDLWALGVVAFECMTGQKPFDAEAIGGLAVAICSDPLPVPSRINPTLPTEVDRWFAQACAREMTQRFHSAKEMADALHLLVAGRPSDHRFVSYPRGLPASALGATEMAVPLFIPPTAPTQPSVPPTVNEPAPTLGITTRAPVSGGAERWRDARKAYEEHVAEWPRLGNRQLHQRAVALLESVATSGHMEAVLLLGRNPWNCGCTAQAGLWNKRAIIENYPPPILPPPLPKGQTRPRVGWDPSNDEAIGRAIKWTQRAVDLADASAHISLGNIYKYYYMDGYTGAAANIEAKKWFRRGAELGGLRGWLELGMLADEKKGSEEAIQMYRAGAELGDADCQYHLAEKHAVRGTEVDIEEAKKWLRRAAAQGNVCAEETLRKDYFWPIGPTPVSLKIGVRKSK
jgi:serine/threonine protein kinase